MKTCLVLAELRHSDRRVRGVVLDFTLIIRLPGVWRICVMDARSMAGLREEGPCWYEMRYSSLMGRSDL